MGDDDKLLIERDALRRYVELTGKMIERIEKGNVYPKDPSLDSLKAAHEDFKRRLESLTN